MRTTVNLPEPLLENVKRRAAARGVTVSTVIEDALRMHLAEGEASAPPFRLFTVRGRLVDPNLNLDRISELVTRDDEADYSAQEK